MAAPVASATLSTARKADRSYVWTNPRPQGNDIYGMSFPTASIGYAVGRTGTVLKTANGGGTWESLDPGEATHLTGVSFTDANSGWVSGASGRILRTSDGGITWGSQLSGTSANLRDIAFSGGGDGIAVGDSSGGTSTIRFTRTGGLLWGTGTTPSSASLNAVSAPSANLAWAVGESGTMVRSTNGGQTWTAGTSLTSASLNAVQFAPGTTIGYAAGNPSGTTWNVFRTVDGIAWTRVTMPGAGQTILGIAVNSTGSRVVLVGAGGVTYRSDNGGTSWVIQNPERLANVTLRAVDMQTADTTGSSVRVAGDFGTLLLSRDSGATWMSDMQTTKYDILGSWFRDANNGYAVGTNGTLLRTTDAGLNWTAKSLGAYTLRGVSMGDGNNIWVVGDGGRMMRSQSGGGLIVGEDFGTPYNTPVPTTAQLNDVYFDNKDNGWVVGNSGTIIRITSASGTPVLTRQTSPTTQSLNSVWFSDSSKGWAVGRNGVILRTTNAGVTWTLQNSNTTANLKDVWSHDNNKAFAVGSGGVVLKTLDAGATWVPLTTVGTTEDLNAVWGDDANRVWVGGANGTVRRTLNAGSTWTAQFPGLPGSADDGGAVNINTLYVRDANKSFVLGDRGEIRGSLDGGLTWTPSYVGTYAGLRGIDSNGVRNAWAVGTAGTIVNSFDGETWYRQNSNTTVDLNAITMPSNTTGWAVGNSGQVRRTVNGGWSWVAMGSGTTRQLNGVDSPNGINVIFVGDGIIRYRTNAAPPVAGTNDSWATGTIPNANLVFNDVSMPTALTAYAVANSGLGATIYKTVNGGAAWTAQGAPAPQTTFNSVDFVDASLGWVVGPGGTIYRTTNGGTTWTQQSSGVTSNLLSVSFSSSTHGRITGAGGVVLGTTNGGLNWTRQDSGTSASLWATSMEAEREGFAAGDAGAILHAYDLTKPVTTWTVTPNAPNGLDDWYVTAPTIQLTASMGATAYYSWISPTGPWTAYSAPLTAPEGMSTLHFFSEDGIGNREPLHTLQFKVDTIAPNAPMNLTGIYDANSVDLDWSASTDSGSGLSGYDVFVNNALVASTAPGQTSVRIEELTPNTLYDIFVIANDVAGNASAPSDLFSFTTMNEYGAPLGAVSTLEPPDPDGMNGWYWTTPTVTLQSLPATTPADIFYSWTSDEPGVGQWTLYSGPFAAEPGATTLYYYSLPQGQPLWPWVLNSRMLLVDPDTPPTPANVVLTAPSPYSLMLSWDPITPTHSGTSHYNIYVDGVNTGSVAAVEEITGYTFEVTGLTPETEYEVRVSAVNVAGTEGPLSPALSEKTLAPPTAEPPMHVYAHAPTGSAVYLNWQYSTDEAGPVSYRIYRSTDDVQYIPIDTVVGRYNYTYIDTGRRPSTRYWYKVTTIDDRGESDRSVGVSAMTGPPERVSGVSATATNAAVTLMWPALTQPQDMIGYMEQYHVYRSTGSLSAMTTLTAEPIMNRVFVDTDAQPGVTYWYRVAAVDQSSAIGRLSVEVSATRPVDVARPSLTPHGSTEEPSNDCAACHRSHTSLGRNLVMSGNDPDEWPERASEPYQQVCLGCHNGRVATDVQRSFEATPTGSRHPVSAGENTGDLYCGSCHSSHRSLETTDAALLDVGGAVSGNEVCYGCHGASSQLPSGDLSMFEESGHGQLTATSPTGIVCGECHERHVSANEQLLYYSDWMVCMQCHVAETDPRMPDILHHVDSGADLRTRHDITHRDQEISGARMSCQNCHNTHAASGQYPLVDPDNPSPTGVWTGSMDDFCLKCHDDALPGEAQTGGWVRPPLGPGGSSSVTNIKAAWNLNVHGNGSATNPQLRPEMGYSAGSTMNCRTCHDGHGSVNAFTLRQDVYSLDGSVLKDGLLVAEVPSGGFDTRFFCNACHDISPAQHAPYADISEFPTDCTGCHRHVPVDSEQTWF